jgi:hypothetical protein
MNVLVSHSFIPLSHVIRQLEQWVGVSWRHIAKLSAPLLEFCGEILGGNVDDGGGSCLNPTISHLLLTMLGFLASSLPQVGDTIISVNGTSVVGKNLAGLADLLLGKPGTEVRTETKGGGLGMQNQKMKNGSTTGERGEPRGVGVWGGGSLW